MDRAKEQLTSQGRSHHRLERIVDSDLFLASEFGKLNKISKENFNMNEYKIIIDNKPFEHPRQFITGREVKEYVKAPSDYGVWLKVRGPGKDKEIGDNEQVDLSQPGREHFFTGPKVTTEG